MLDTAPVKWLPWKMLVGRSSAPFPTARVIVESGARHIEVVEDLFAPDVTDSQRDRAFVLMAIASALTFRVVTRYPAAARLYLSKGTVAVSEAIRHAAPHLGPAVSVGLDIPWVWLLLRASAQADLDQGVPELLETPAALRGVLLDGPVEKVDLTTLPSRFRGDDRPLYRIDALRGQHRCGPSVVYAGTKLDWIVLRGATGPNAKPLHPDIARSVRDQCQDAKVPFCFESWGEWSPAPQGGNAATLVHDWPNGERFFRVGQRAAVRLLDGKVWDDMPEVAHAG
ncbi:DUF5131 family protein [Azospirillum argentinense]|uniref:DUF5131 family protein n=1 Tax=Azospirillum brasilense TaxID=192 RepID=A0A4D8QAF2_AZOBR|nr:DUF5131 family protein [Azospirillum argentinense]QCO07345.1 DUF5131 family protein [Azospirillum argentinense]